MTPPSHHTPRYKEIRKDVTSLLLCMVGNHPPLRKSKLLLSCLWCQGDPLPLGTWLSYQILTLQALLIRACFRKHCTTWLYFVTPSIHRQVTDILDGNDLRCFPFIPCVCEVYLSQRMPLKVWEPHLCYRESLVTVQFSLKIKKLLWIQNCRVLHLGGVVGCCCSVVEMHPVM